jgi:queuine tRNA-ribosyltransferase
LNTLATAHGVLELPAFLPDATRGVVRSIDADDVARCGIRAIMVNTLHLQETPGVEPVRGAGGIHRFMGWDGPVASDSGGFQVYSLQHAAGQSAKASERGFSYTLKPGGPRRMLTAERCVRQQLRLGTDVVFCLDECTHPDGDRETQRASVDRTLRWARTGIATVEEEMNRRGGERPLLFGVVQGGPDRDLRRRCAEGLIELGFDGFGFGGWPVDDGGGLVEMVAEVAELLPTEAPKHALGIGRPESVVAAFRAGYGMFDCTLPTRNARRGVLYVFTGDAIGEDPGFYRHLRLDAERFRRDRRPIEEGCDCPTCERYSRSYLAHLHAIGDSLALRLATLHNLRFYARLMEQLRG